MPIIVTPGHLSKRAEFYQQLAQLTAAGVGLIPSLEQLKNHPPANSYREPLARTIREISHGCTLNQALGLSTGWLPDFDLALLKAGEQTGRLDASFRHLASYYFDRARLARRMISQLVYPIGLIHFAVLVFGVILPFAYSQFNASLLLLFFKALLWLLPFYLLTGLLIYASQNKHGEQWRAVIETISHRIPLLGAARRNLALARLAAALEALISAGINVIEAWDIAAQACGSPALRKTIATWKPRLAARQTPADIMRSSPRFPGMFANLYATGESSGKLDDSLRQLHVYFQEEGTRKLELIAQLTPRLIYLAVALVIAYAIIRFYLGYFAQVREAGGF